MKANYNRKIKAREKAVAFRTNSDIFEKEYICNWVTAANNADNDKDYAEVSEDEFMEILNK